MKVLILGAEGQLGRCLQDQYRGSAVEMLAANRQDLDIVNREAVNRFFEVHQPTIVFNCAAYTAVDKAESDKATAYAVNAEAVGSLAHAANLVDATLVHISTDYVFDGSKGDAYEETDVVCPLGVYGASKLAGEREAAEAAKHYIVRVGWLFSEYGNNFLKTMLRLAETRNELSVVADQTGTPSYAGDLAVAINSLAFSEAPFGLYHFNGGTACSWYDFAVAIFQEAEEASASFSRPALKPIGAKEYPTEARRPAYSVLDDSKLCSQLSGGLGDWEKVLPKVVRSVLFS